MKRMGEKVGLAAICVFAGVASISTAGEPSQPKALYLRYCSACHGDGGKGDGPVSGFLEKKPTDLTQIAKKAGGKFPYLETMKAIDGRTTIRAHGDPAMPVWSESFQRETTSDGYVYVRGQLMLITDYIESIQEK